MIEIIPNWHPIFVHFTVALYSTVVGFYILHYTTNYLWVLPKTYVNEFEVVARWCLWAVALLTIITVLAGLQAFNTVSHDAPSHIAMLNHRNWALPTAGAILFVALWSVWRYYRRRSVTLTFLLAVLVVQGLLLATAWRGAELVYRYGLGVISLPKSEGAGHQHHDSDNSSGGKMSDAEMDTMGQ
jgi:uncharacterized membrane protein